MTKKLLKYRLESELFPSCISCYIDKIVLSLAYFWKNSDILKLLNPCNINEKAIFKNIYLRKSPLVLPNGSTVFFP